MGRRRWAWWTLLIGNTIALPSAMAYDRVVRAIGPFEVLEYAGLVMIVVALALTARARKWDTHTSSQIREEV